MMTPAGDDKHAQPAPRHEHTIGLAVLTLLLVGSFIVLRPFISALLWAIVLAFSLWPVQGRLTRWMGQRRALAALLITLTLAAALFVPLLVTVANLADDARSLAAVGRGWFQTGPPPAPTWLRNTPVVGRRAAIQWEVIAAEINAVLRERRAENQPTTAPSTTAPFTTAPTTGPTTAPSERRSKLRQTLRSIITWAKSWVIAFAIAIGQGVMQVALSLLLMFFILKDGEALAGRLRAMAHRISGEQGIGLLHVAGGTVRGVVYGILGTALAQGLMAGIGFLIAGVPGATLLGLLTFFASVIPMGPPLIWIPAAIWLFYRGSAGWGVFMLIWGVGVSSIDNVIKPLIISRGSKMPFILILLGVLGGALAFGLIGVFIGPTLLAVAYRLVDEWSRARSEALVRASSDRPDQTVQNP
jgi:predicted PurR-regulated permease PerM